MHKPALSVLLTLACAAACPDSADAAIHVTVSYTIVDTASFPRRATYRTFKTHTYDLDRSTALKADERTFTKAGERISRVKRVIGGELIWAEAFDDYISVIRIRTDGTRSCAATKDFTLRRGHASVRYVDPRTGQEQRFSNKRFENVTCSITDD